MYKVLTDEKKNRMVVTFAGILTGNEAYACKETIKKEVIKLTPGFDVIDDISNFHLGQDSAGPALKEILGYFSSHNVNMIVQVVGSSETGLIQFVRLTGAADSRNLKYVPTFKDAESILEKKL
jgi:hypothetical protein